MQGIDVETAGLLHAIDRVEREIALIQEFRARLIADVVTGKLDVRAAATNLPEMTDREAIEEAAEGEDLEPAPDQGEPEEAVA